MKIEDLIEFVKTSELSSLHKNICDKILVQKNAEYKGRTFDTYIIEMIEHNNAKHVKILLDAGVDPNMILVHGSSLLDHAVFQNNNSIAEMLIKAGATVNIKNNFGMVPLFYVQNLIMADLLLKNGADPKIKDRNGQTILFRIENTEIMEMMLNYVDPNIQDNYGDTVLHEMIHNYIIGMDIDRENIYDIIVILINHGADILIKGSKGKSVFQIVCNLSQKSHFRKLKKIPAFRNCGGKSTLVMRLIK